MKKIKLFIGIDVSKGWIDIAVIHYQNPYEYGYKRFSNTTESFVDFLNWLEKNYTTNIEECLFCLEHTGLYSMPICVFLTEKNAQYVVESALQIKRSMGITRGKSDKADSKTIARYIKLHKDDVRLYKMPCRTLIDLKALLSFRERLKKQKHALKVASKELNGFTIQSTYEFVDEHSSEIISIINLKLKEIEKQINQLMNSDKQLRPLFKLSTSVKGVGLIISAYMIYYTNCFTRFESWRKFSYYAGSAPFEYTSGKTIKGKTKVSHLANKMMKALLTNGAYSAIQHDRELRNFFQRKIKQGKEEFFVINIIRNKLISRVFAAVKRGTPYVPIMNYC